MGLLDALGLGKSKTVQKTNIDISTKLITSVMAEAIQNCAGKVESNQDINITNSSGVRISRVSQDGSATVTVKCNMTNEQVAKLQQDITNKIKQNANQQSEALLGAIGDITGKKKTQLTSMDVSTVIKNNITAKLVQKVTTSLKGGQKINVSNSTNVAVSDIHQKLTLTGIEAAASAQIQNTSLIQKVKNNEDQEALQKTNNPFKEILDGVGDMVSSIFGGSSGIIIAIICIICAFGLYSYMRARSGGYMPMPQFAPPLMAQQIPPPYRQEAQQAASALYQGAQAFRPPAQQAPPQARPILQAPPQAPPQAQPIPQAPPQAQPVQ
jgi:hypothetical protein